MRTARASESAADLCSNFGRCAQYSSQGFAYTGRVEAKFGVEEERRFRFCDHVTYCMCVIHSPLLSALGRGAYAAPNLGYSLAAAVR